MPSCLPALQVRERMGRLRERLVEHVTQVLTPESPPTGAPHGRWPKAWSLVKAILGGSGGAGRHAAAALGEQVEGREGEEELQMKLAELHSAIYLQASLAGQASQPALLRGPPGRLGSGCHC